MGNFKLTTLDKYQMMLLMSDMNKQNKGKDKTNGKSLLDPDGRVVVTRVQIGGPQRKRGMECVGEGGMVTYFEDV